MKNLSLWSVAVALVLSLQTNSYAGVDQVDIVGGSVVDQSSPIARMVAYLYFEDAQKKGWVCTGSLMGGNRILTAAHCTNNATVGYAIFTTNGRDLTKVPKTSMRKIYDFHQTSTFTEALPMNGEWGEVGIVKFQGELPAGFQAATLLKATQFNQYIKMGTPITIAGYGVTVQGESETGLLKQAVMNVSGISANKKDLYLQGLGNASCSGDSGGPMYYNLNGQYLLMGVLSRGDCSANSIYTLYMHRDLRSSGM